MSIQEKCINKIIEVEGGYVNHSSDLGGQTNFGITEKVAKENGYNGDMKDMPKSVAYQIYVKKYWDVNKLTQISELSEKIALEVADTGVNMGVKVAAIFLQRSLNALNVLNEKGTLFKDLVLDGSIGQKTINALELILKNRKGSELVILRILNSLQGARYVELAEAREANKDFILGWFLNRVEI